jgi:hypothetical protein
MRGMRVWTAVAAVAAGIACGGETTAPAIESGTGAWVGETSGITLRLNLHDLSGSLRGDGSLSNAKGESASFTVLSGSWGDAANKLHAMSLTFTGTSTTPVTFSCTTQVAELCDGPLRFSDGNTIYFEIARPVAK